MSRKTDDERARYRADHPYMTRDRVIEHQDKIRTIDATLEAMPQSQKQGGNVIYEALWLYRDTLVAQLPKKDRDAVQKKGQS